MGQIFLTFSEHKFLTLDNPSIARKNKEVKNLKVSDLPRNSLHAF